MRRDAPADRRHRARSARALLRRLTADGRPVRCLVRDPRRLGPERVRVQLALGDLTDPPSFRNALRGVKTVVHLAASGARPAARARSRSSTASRPGGSSTRPSAPGSSTSSSSARCRRRPRPHALPARQGARRAGRARVRPAAHDLRPVARLLAGRPAPHAARAARLLPVVPVPGPRARAVPADLGRRRRRLRHGRARGRRRRPCARHELAGPDTLDHVAVAELVLRAPAGRGPLVGVPERVTRAGLRTLEAL